MTLYVIVTYIIKHDNRYDIKKVIGDSRTNVII